MDDLEDSDEGQGGRNKGKPSGRRMEKDNKNKKAEVASLKDHIEKLRKSKETTMAKHMDSKLAMIEKKQELK
jgi:hypothetical protein